MKYSNIPSAQTVVHHCMANRIKNIVISPGSRNAPLIIGFTGNPFFRCFSIVDERCAAFFALGMAQQLKEPVAVICTSGSALLNYYPAVAEAFYSDIPLVVISADRPQYKIDIGDGQTIRQDYVFDMHIAYSANLKQDVVHATDKLRAYTKVSLDNDFLVDVTQTKVQEYNENELHKALGYAKNNKAPVHINVPLEEPLYGVLDQPSVAASLLYQDDEQGVKWELPADFISIWNNAKRKMVVVGTCSPNSIEQQFLDELAEDDSVLVFTETTSNLHHSNFFPSIDSIIAPIEKLENAEERFKALQPEILLTFGGLIVSKKIKAFLRSYRPEHHWHIDPKKALDTFFSLSHHFKTDTNTFFDTFFAKVSAVESDYYEKWATVKKHYEAKRENYLKTIEFSDMLAFYHICNSIPKHYQLQLANSSTVRYAQLFTIDSTIKIYCNRGASGIEGCTSTAIGASVYNKEPTLLITGDLSFLYDSNGLWNNYIRSDFRVIVINNAGGGIFRILPGNNENERFETYFETVHDKKAEQLCSMYHIDYNVVNDEEGLHEILNSFFKKSKQPRLLEIMTPRLLNDKILLSYFDFISLEQY